jgi:uncharacterized BrkB/YihY/UPF0761 family membrane protein
LILNHPLIVAARAKWVRWWPLCRPTARYLMETEVHVYALAIAACVMLTFFPFLTVMLCLFRDVLHWPTGIEAIYLAVRDVFPGRSGGVVAQNLQSWMVPHLPLTSVFLLLFTSNGIFEPLEVALNRAWGVTTNRSYWKNQLVSLGLVFVCGALVLLSLAFTAYNREWVTSLAGEGTVATWLMMLVFKIAAVPVSILMLFLIYWLLPNRRIDPMQVAPVAIWVGLSLEMLKYLNILVRPWLMAKMEREYHMFQYSVVILLGSFLAALIVLAGAEFSARRGRASDPVGGGV